MLSRERWDIIGIVLVEGSLIELAGLLNTEAAQGFLTNRYTTRVLRCKSLWKRQDMNAGLATIFIYLFQTFFTNTEEQLSAAKPIRSQECCLCIQYYSSIDQPNKMTFLYFWLGKLGPPLPIAAAIFGYKYIYLYHFQYQSSVYFVKKPICVAGLSLLIWKLKILWHVYLSCNDGSWNGHSSNAYQTIWISSACDIAEAFLSAKPTAYATFPSPQKVTDCYVGELHIALRRYIWATFQSKQLDSC